MSIEPSTEKIFRAPKERHVHSIWLLPSQVIVVARKHYKHLAPGEPLKWLLLPMNSSE